MKNWICKEQNEKYIFNRLIHPETTEITLNKQIYDSVGFMLLHMHLNALFEPIQDLKSEPLLGMRNKSVTNTSMLVNNYMTPKLL